jgi:hypothetical protein
MEILRTGERFPAPQASAVDGSKVRIPDDRHDTIGARIVALSTDRAEEARGTVEQLGL